MLSRFAAVMEIAAQERPCTLRRERARRAATSHLASRMRNICLLILSLALATAGCANEDPAAFDGVCLGEPHPAFSLCGELFNDDGRAFCNMHDGCEWEDCGGSCGFCDGNYLGCRNRVDSAGCAAEPGCDWFAPPMCATWEECVVTWLDSGGCAEIRPGAVGYIEYVDGREVRVDFADHCP